MRRRWISLVRPEPVSDVFGLDRGTPVDRRYIDRFLGANRDAIRGRVLEVGADDYSRAFGKGIEQQDVLHAVPGNPQATIVGDLQDPATLPQGAFDCIVLIQTLQFVPRPEAALESCRLALREGGVLLATVPGISQVSRYDMDRWGDFWRFTDRGATELFRGAFADRVTVTAMGNAATAAAFVQGVSAEELRPRLFESDHRDYPVIVGVRAEAA